MPVSKVTHTIIRNQNLFCTHCGAEYKMNYPMPITGKDSFAAKVENFNKIHKKCPPTWLEPVPDLNTSIEQRAYWWRANCEIGLSSMTMWRVFMKEPQFGPIYYPSDPDDFSRCYKLLQVVPEWRNELSKLKNLTQPWSNLVDNWDRLTEMFEQNTREKWQNADRIGMHDLMKKLITSDKKMSDNSATSLKSKLSLKRVPLTEEYRQLWNISPVKGDFFRLFKNDQTLRNTLYGKPFFADFNNDKYVLLHKYIESYYSEEILKRGISKSLGYLAQHYVIIDEHGNEKKVFDQFDTVYLEKNSPIYVCNSAYHNIETNHCYGRPTSVISSTEFLFLQVDGVVKKINKQSGQCEIFE